MSDSRIINLPLAEEITDNDFFVFDGLNSGTKKISKATLLGNIEANIESIESNVTDIESEIGDTVLPTTAQTLSGAIAEHESDISALNSKITNLIKTKPYSVTPDSNSSVSPFSYYKEVAIDVTYTTILGVKIVGGGSTNPSVVKLNSTGTTIWYYSAKNSAVTVELVYI